MTHASPDKDSGDDPGHSQTVLDLHLEVLQDLLNGISFPEIKTKYEHRFREVDYLHAVRGPLLTFDEDDKLIGAYPVSPVPSDYKVTIEDIGTGYAMCAVDALGIAYTFKKKTIIETQTTDTREHVELSIDPHVSHQEDQDLFVTYLALCDDITNIATQQCPNINFYGKKENIPNHDDIRVMDLQPAVEHAKSQFSQAALLRCIERNLT